MSTKRSKEDIRQIVLALIAVLLFAVVLWVEFTTGIWQELVILAGITAGLVTFIFTVLVLERMVARSTARRWYPVTRFALTEFLHALADEEHSDITRREIVPRSLSLSVSVTDSALPDRLHDLRSTVVNERKLLADALSTWSSFLTSSSGNEELLFRVATIAVQLDEVRDQSLRLEHSRSSSDLELLEREIETCNEHLAGLVDEVTERLAIEAKQYRRSHSR